MTNRKMKRVHRDRMRKLANFLVNDVKDDAFDMSRWYLDEQDNSCGTIACAFGWAPTCFPKSDLALKNGTVFYKGYSGFSASCQFFGLTTGAAEFLFDAGQYDSNTHRIHVANRLKKFARTHGQYYIDAMKEREGRRVTAVAHRAAL